MGPKKSTTGTGSTKTKRSSGLGQPTLSFAQQRKATSSSKTKSKTQTGPIIKTESAESISVHESTPEPEQVDLTLQDSRINEDSKVDLKVEGKEREKERKNLNVKSKEWAGAYRDAKVAMGNMEPIHAGPDTHNQVHHILRVFDMTSKYGPSVGMTRLQRWERAQKWGLNPPKEIYSILTTKEGEEDASYRENVLHTWL